MSNFRYPHTSTQHALPVIAQPWALNFWPTPLPTPQLTQLLLPPNPTEYLPHLPYVADLALQAGQEVSQAYCATGAPVIREWAANPGLLDQLLEQWQAASVQLERFVYDMELIKTSLEGISQEIFQVSSMPWRSTAGDAFTQRTLKARTRSLASVVTAAQAIDIARQALAELNHKIGRFREIAQQARQVAATVLTGAC